MGIRFTCPNGHKLHVKSFLAGKRGICPHCGVGVDIPLENQNPPGPGASPAASSRSPSALAETPSALPQENAASATAPSDPIAAAPDAVWYLRSPAGDQFGPASGQTMRAWIAEGRVTPDSLVWREGWDDWRIAQQAFPSLPTPNSPASASPSGPIIQSPLSTDTALRLPERDSSRPGYSPAAGRRRQSTNYAITAVVTLAVASAVLLVALIYVLVTQR